MNTNADVVQERIPTKKVSFILKNECFMNEKSCVMVWINKIDFSNQWMYWCMKLISALAYKIQRRSAADKIYIHAVYQKSVW